MAIEIYSKACVIKKDNKYYYFLKHHSKNDAICRGQYTVDGNFNNKYLRRDGRGGEWSIKAHGTEKEHKTNEIACTYWNAPTSQVYGTIQFGNKLNIALYWSKCRVKNFEDFTEEQKINLDEYISWYEKNTHLQCNLFSIPIEKKLKTKSNYGHYELEDNRIVVKGRDYWNLNNL